MDKLYSAKYMTEASATLADKVLKKSVQETYLFSSIQALSELNESVDSSTKKLYEQIYEAASKADENKLFGEYYYQFKKVFEDFGNKLNEMKSRLIINVENKVESWEDLFTDDSYISNFNDKFNFDGYEFSHMEDANFPRLSLMKYYQKEFDYLGQLMQDAGIGASPTAKLKIIASVSNNFANCSGDKKWINDILKDMVALKDDQQIKSYSEILYNSLRIKKNIEVDKGYLYSCKENLSDYNDYIEAASKLCDNLLSELDKIGENISSYLFRNKDNTLKIKTDTDGVIDRSYRLDTYSMNQLDIFLRSKVNQIKKLLNIYTIAIGIKFDAISDLISQNISILRRAKSFANGVEDVEFTDDTNDVEPTEDKNLDGTSDMDTDDIPDENKETLNEEDPKESDYDYETDFELQNDTFGNDIDDTDDKEDDTVQEPSNEEYNLDDDSEDFNESYLFEAELFELQLMYESESLKDHIMESVLMEEETSGIDKTKELVNKNAKAPSLWQRFIQKLAELWKRFREFAIERTKEKIEYLKENSKYISHTVTKEYEFKTYDIDLNELNSIKLPDLNYNSMKESLKDEATFREKYFRELSKDKDKSISDNMKDLVLVELKDKSNVAANKVQKLSIKEAYDFCINYPDNINRLKAQIEIIQKGERSAINIAKSLNESANLGFMQYFNEADDEKDKQKEEPKTPENKENTEKEKSKVSETNDNLQVYFKVCGQVLSAEMTIYQKIFNESYKFCKWYIGEAKGENGEGGESKENSTPTQTTDFD